jgi:hypothetical protein
VATERLRVPRRAPGVAYLVLGSLSLTVAAVSLVAGAAERWLVGLFLVLGVLQLLLAVGFLRQHLDLSDGGLQVTQGIRTRRVVWDEVVHVHLDWAADAAGRGDEALCIDRRAGARMSSGVIAGMGEPTDPRRQDLEATLRDHAREHGFTLEVTDPSWRRRAAAADDPPP